MQKDPAHREHIFRVHPMQTGLPLISHEDLRNSTDALPRPTWRGLEPL